MAVIKKNDNTKCYQAIKDAEKLDVSYMLERMSDGRHSGQYLTILSKPNMQLSYGPTIALFDIYPREIQNEKKKTDQKNLLSHKACLQMFISVLFVIARTGNNPDTIQQVND